MQTIKQTGLRLDLDIVKPEDSIFGVVGSRIVDDIDMNGNWLPYLSKGEHQHTGKYEPFSCVSHSVVKAIQAIFNYKKAMGLLPDSFLIWCETKGYFDENGDFQFADRFIAKLSDTDIYQGNTGQRVNDTVRKFGLVPESLWPTKINMGKYEYYKKIDREVMELGAEWEEWVDFLYERAFQEDFSEALTHSPLQVYVHAWPKPINGVYPRTLDQIQHACVLADEYPDEKKEAHDTYTEDARRGIDFEKTLASDFLFHVFGYKYQILIKKKSMSEPKNELVKKVEVVGSNGRGFYIEAMTADIYKQLSQMYGVKAKLKKDGSVDWDNEDMDGEVKLYAQPKQYEAIKKWQWPWSK